MLALAVAAAGSGQAVAANLLANGSFELLKDGSAATADYTGVGHVNGISQGPNDYLQGWVPYASGFEHFDATSPAYSANGGSAVAKDGAYVVDLAPYTFTGGGIEQTVALGAGSYSLTFWATTSQLAGRSGTGLVDVAVLSGSPSSQQYTVTNYSVNVTANDWQPFAFAFTLANPGPTTIRFSNGQDPYQHFAFIDNVALVPEPHEWAMMLAGLGMVGVIAKRRRSARTEF
jgi:hypothetical protein